MNAPLHQPIADRILDAFPSGSYALSALLRLMDTLGWFPGDREARVLEIAGAAGECVSAERVARCVDLTLEKSGEAFLVRDLVEVARWGHFEEGERPWEVTGQI